jgi:hypothetical protein
MKMINSTNWLELPHTVDWIRQVDDGEFTEFVYICECGKKHFDVYKTCDSNGDQYPITKKRKICGDCGRVNIVPGRKMRQ